MKLAGAAVHIRHQQGLYSQICAGARRFFLHVVMRFHRIVSLAGEGWGRHSLRCQPLARGLGAPSKDRAVT